MAQRSFIYLPDLLNGGPESGGAVYECFLRGQSRSGGTCARLIHFMWPEPTDSMIANPDHVITMALSPLPPNTRVRLVGYNSEFVETGPILFQPANIPMAGMCDGGFHASLVCGVSDDKFRSLAGRPFVPDAYDLHRVFDLPPSTFRPYLMRIAQELSEPTFGSASVIELLINLMFFDLLRYLGNDRFNDPHFPRKGGLADWQLRKINGRIEREDACPPTVAELAEDLGVSSRHLLRVYRSTTGITLQQQIRRISEKRALRLVTETDMPLKIIAQQLGFELPGSFSTAFRNSFGISPRELRKRR